MPKKSEENSSIELSRRGFLTSIAGVAVALAASGAIAKTSPVSKHDRELSFYNTHTGEKLSATFWSNGKYLDDGIEEISWLMRDHRAGIASAIDPKLLDVLHQLQT